MRSESSEIISSQIVLAIPRAYFVNQGNLAAPLKAAHVYSDHQPKVPRDLFVFCNGE